MVLTNLSLAGLSAGCYNYPNNMFDIFNSFVVYANTDTSTGSGRGGLIDNPINVNTLREFVGKILEVVVYVGLPLLVVAVVYVGFLFVAARGSETKLTEAKQALLAVVIGAAIVLGAFVIAEAIDNTITSLR